MEKGTNKTKASEKIVKVVATAKDAAAKKVISKDRLRAVPHTESSIDAKQMQNPK
jgi:hypothetical protein